jgi:putative membrane protein
MHIQIFFLVCVIAAGAYGGYSVSPKIVLVQAAPAVLALILVWLS